MRDFDQVRLREPVLLHAVRVDPEEAIGLASQAVRDGQELEQILGGFSVPIYVTDSDGYVTYFNSACRDFAGRNPVVGKDRWCVTWQLQTESGDSLPHDRCPLALAIEERRAIRGVVAVAIRPDGTRVLFQPLPTPIFDEHGDLVGAVNILVDVTDLRQAGALKTQALRCRRLAASVTDPRTIDTLTLMAEEYDREATTLEEKSGRAH